MSAPTLAEVIAEALQSRGWLDTFDAEDAAPHVAEAVRGAEWLREVKREVLLQASSEWASEYDRLTRDQPAQTKTRAAYRLASVLAEQRSKAQS